MINFPISASHPCPLSPRGKRKIYPNKKAAGATTKNKLYKIVVDLSTGLKVILYFLFTGVKVVWIYYL